MNVFWMMADVDGPWQTDGVAVVMPVAPCFFLRDRQGRPITSKLNWNQESVRGQTIISPDNIFSKSPLSPWHISVTASFALALVPLRHETPPASRSLSERHRAPLLPQVPPIADGAGADHACSPRAGIA